MAKDQLKLPRGTPLLRELQILLLVEANVILIAVGTPSRENGQADTKYVEAAACEISEGLLPNHKYTVIVKSTVPVGSNRRVQRVIHEVPSGKGFAQCISVNVALKPEFLREATALHDTLYPDRIVVGDENPEVVDVLRQLCQPILELTFDEPAVLPRPKGYDLPSMVTTDPVSAELIKYASNAFLAMRISYINEIAGVCERVGGNITEVARGMGLDSRISPSSSVQGELLPQGHCCTCGHGGNEFSCPLRFVDATCNSTAHNGSELSNGYRRSSRGFVDALSVCWVYPSSQARTISESLRRRRLSACSSSVRRMSEFTIPLPWTMPGSNWKALVSSSVRIRTNSQAGADAIVLATEWPEYRILDLEKLATTMRTPVLVDARNLFDRSQAISAGFIYLTVGR